MSSEDKKVLRPGAFYWVLPVFDVDFTAPGFDYSDNSQEAHAAAFGHWTQGEQPAFFKGYGAGGEEQWVYLGQDEKPEHWWPTRWVGDEIVKK